MRIVSLLPSATESLFALGLGGSLVAVTHECDYPPEASSLPIVTRSTLGLHEKASAGIEVAVSEAAMAGRSLYLVDTEAIHDLEPDLVIAQDVCRVCAVSADQVAVELDGIRMIRQHPHSLHDVLADIEALAAACGADAAPLMSRLNARIDAAAHTAHRRRAVRGVFLEWLDPPYPAGHWTPDLLALAGIEDPLARPGAPSVAMSWADVAEARPELLVLAPCGFGRERRRLRPIWFEPRSSRSARTTSWSSTGPRTSTARAQDWLTRSSFWSRTAPRNSDSARFVQAGRGISPKL